MSLEGPEDLDYPPGTIFVGSLTNAARTIYSTSETNVHIRHIVIAGGAADEIVIFRDLDDVPERCRVSVLAGTTVVIPGWGADDQGCEVLTASAAGDVTVACFIENNSRTVVA